MKILTVLGTRPEIIRLSRVIEKLDRHSEHVLVHTGQNYDPHLSDIFFTELNVRKPNYYLGIKGDSFGQQVGRMLEAVDEVLAKEQPDRMLILGDTNSGLGAILAKRRGIPVFHMEAGNRCYDDRVPEEVNRRIIDHSSDILMPYTERSRQNLLREGIPGERIFVTGNPIYEVIRHYQSQIERTKVLAELDIEPRLYFLVTLHRAENVDSKARLKQFAAALTALQNQYEFPIIISTHPHTRSRLEASGIAVDNPKIRWLEPFGFFDFLTLEQNACCVLSDSGTVQEECAIFRIPNVTLRDVSERPETLECGSNLLTGANADLILACVKTVLADPPGWDPPREYLVANVSRVVVNILTGVRYL
jgi:UDP-N-acetylglucosamine 2-epimerase (non-hydrolysing)